MTVGKTEPIAVDESFLKDLLKRGVEAFNAHDAEGFVAVMTDDVVIDHSAWPTPLRGHAQVATFYADYIWTAFPDARLELEDGPFLHPHAARFSVAWRASGTHEGPLDPPGLAPSGRQFEIAVREVAAIRDERLCRLQIVLDMADLMRQLGVLPAQGSRAERAMAALQRLQMRVPSRGR